MWAEEIIITYADGTEASLKPLMFNRPWPLPASVTYEGQEITYIYYRISGAATGTEYTTCSIDVSSFIFTATVGDIWERIVEDYTSPWYLEMNGAPEVLVEMGIPIGSVFATASSGEYTVTFEPSGSILYRGENGADSEWFTAILPPGKSVVVDNMAGTITLDLSATVGSA